MDLLLYKIYLKFLKENKLSWSKALTRAPKSLVLLLIFMVLSIVAPIIVLLISKNTTLYTCCLIVEFIVSFISFYYSQSYEINNSARSIEEYKIYCKKLHSWFKSLSVLKKKEDVEEIKARVDNHIKKHEKRQEKTMDMLIRVIQSLVIPVVLSILAVLISKQVDISTIFTYGFMAILFPVFLGITLFGVVSLFSLLKRRKYEKLIRFSNDLQGILDTQFIKDN